MFGWVAAVAQAIWDGIQAVADAVVVALTFAFKALKLFGTAVWDAGKFVYKDVLKPIGMFVDRVYKHVRDFIQKVYAPIHGWLTRISKALRLVYTHYVRPILNLIDGTRKILELLALLHVQWAAKLDAELAALERKLSAPILQAIQVINAIDSRIEGYILTADHLFQRVTFLRTLKRDVNAVANIQWNASIKAMSAGHETWLTGAAGLEAVDTHVQSFGQVLEGNELGSGVNVSDIAKTFDAALTTGTFDDGANDAAAAA